ncbi:hypothetical protein A2Z67_02370 [Candidatus Woesebacteria bacterium RBG_13_36_22]|uniref:Uncharacterized protein n=1 Tax=Candidatus Woesebacteria bacterium RBG_13_36_22 TaxID=1802478 RepID=A0A1F7X279_9BACT|nr:MAG: hypothetical protein A2Z67_02370 [Candidatus Woesebacteria bacterium RBG_13_36_22]
MNWLIKIFLYLRVRYKWFKEVKDIPNYKLTFSSIIQPDFIKDYFPWGSNPNAKTNYDQLRQRYGRFHCRMRLLDKGCFWLLNISHQPYDEIDHIEIEDKFLYVTTWHNRHGGQKQVEPEENVNPLYTGHNHTDAPHRCVKYYDPLIRQWILNDSHLFTVIWRKWFVAWRIDNILIGVKLFYPIPRQQMYMIATNCEWTYFESTL